MSFRVHAVRSLLAGAATLAVASPAWAQTQQEDQAQATNQATEAQQGDLIIVTATKRASTVQDVPFSINAQTQEDIQRANANTIEDISRNVAGLAVQNLQRWNMLAASDRDAVIELIASLAGSRLPAAPLYRSETP